MPSVRTLAAVAHNTAHHAASSMSWLHPHAGLAARAQGAGELRFDLLASSPLSTPTVSDALRASTEGLRQTFFGMLHQHGFAPEQLRQATLTMLFPTSDEH